jgi:response regulator NasT
MRVVIAEDEALIRLDLREMLVDEGYDVVGEAADGEQAVALAGELAPDLVICDIKMPKMDGIAAAAHITEKRIAPVVMLTAFSQRDLIERARDAGAMAYLVKPFDKRDLLPAIEMAMSRFAEIKALEDEVSEASPTPGTGATRRRPDGILIGASRLCARPASTVTRVFVLIVREHFLCPQVTTGSRRRGLAPPQRVTVLG